jgi:hypothetical protein
MQLMLRGRRSKRADARADEFLIGEFAESSSGAVAAHPWAAAALSSRR